MNNNKNINQTTEIDLLVLFRRILMKWRQLIIFMVIFGILVGGVGYLKSGVEVYADTGAKVATDEKKEIFNARAALSDSEIKETDIAIDNYIRYSELLKDSDTYMNESVLMQLDANNVSNMKTSYYIDDHYEVVYPQIETSRSLYNIISAYSDALTDDTTMAEAKEALGWNKDTKYISELVSVNSEGDGIMTVSVNADSEENCIIIMQVLDESITEATEGIQTQFGDFDITAMGTTYNVVDDSTISAKQVNEINTQNSYTTNMSKLTANLTSDEKTYYELVTDEIESTGADLRDEAVALPEIKKATDSEKTNSRETIKADRSISAKYVAIGIILGFIIVCGWVCVQYICSGRLYDSKDMRSRYGLDLYGEINDSASGSRVLKGLDKRIYYMFRTDKRKSAAEQTDRICTEMAMSIEQKQYTNVTILCSADTDNYRSIVANITEGVRKVLAEDGKSSAQINTIVAAQNDDEGIKVLTDSDAAFVIEAEGVSEYCDIDSEIKLCTRYGAALMGAAVIA